MDVTINRLDRASTRTHHEFSTVELRDESGGTVGIFLHDAGHELRAKMMADAINNAIKPAMTGADMRQVFAPLPADEVLALANAGVDGFVGASPLVETAPETPALVPPDPLKDEEVIF